MRLQRRGMDLPCTFQHDLILTARTWCRNVQAIMKFPPCMRSILIMGCSSVQDAAAKAQIVLQQYPAGQFKISNIAADGCFGFAIDLEKALQMYGQQHKIGYTPELFPTLRWTVGEKAVASIFGNGHFTMTGAKAELAVNEAFEQLCALLRPCALQQ